MRRTRQPLDTTTWYRESGSGACICLACGVLVSTWCGRKKHVASYAHRRKLRETEAVDASPNIPSSAMAPAREEQRKLRANGGGEFYPAPRSRVKKLFGDRWFEGVIDEVAPGDRFPITVRFDDWRYSIEGLDSETFSVINSVF